jgi:hypothetical protein
MKILPQNTMDFLLTGRKNYSWGLSKTLVRFLPPLSIAAPPLTVAPGKFAMKSLKQISYVAVTPTTCGARLGHQAELAAAPFQS